MKDIVKQYDGFARKYSDWQQTSKGNQYSRKLFHSNIDFLKKGSTILDAACGDGLDMVYYKQLGAKVVGVDASKKMVEIATRRLPDVTIKVAKLEKMPFPDRSFDAVLSKYALMTSTKLNPIFQEFHRVLKPGGIMLYLVTHPMRQYFERKNLSDNYFTQKLVQSRVFNNQITFVEPTHTLNEYFTPFVLKNFDILKIEEHPEPEAERNIKGVYPGFLLVKAVKK